MTMAYIQTYKYTQPLCICSLHSTCVGKKRFNFFNKYTHTEWESRKKLMNNVPGQQGDWLAAGLWSAEWHSCEPDWICPSVDQRLAAGVHFAEVMEVPMTGNNFHKQLFKIRFTQQSIHSDKVANSQHYHVSQNMSTRFSSTAESILNQSL